jgi:uncharacterized membrane protein
MQVAMEPRKPQASRIRALDWHRGLAVIVMIECHALAYLHPSHDAEPLRTFLNSINGLVAPSFIFAAGFALSMVSCRAAAGDSAGRKARALKTLMRIGEVLVVSNILKWTLWPVRDEPWQWLRVDVLSCIAYSLFVLWCCVFSLGDRPRGVAAAMAALAALIFGLSPWTESLRGLGLAQFLVNNSSGSEFPVLPWAGYAFAGASLGALMSIPGRGPALLWRGLAAMFAAGLAMALCGPVADRVYPWDTWILTNAGERVAKTAGIALALRALEALGTSRGWAMRNPATRTLEHFGLSSLSGYFFQASALFGLYVALPLGWSFKIHPLGVHVGYGRLHWAGFWVLTAGVIAAVGALVKLWDYVDPLLPWRATRKKEPKPAPATESPALPSAPAP